MDGSQGVATVAQARLMPTAVVTMSLALDVKQSTGCP
jgi:hypothetical protein